MLREDFAENAPGEIVGLLSEKTVAFVPNTLPPKEISLCEETQDASINAAVKLGELKGAGTILPNPGLLISPFVRREALLSSRIEGTQTDSKEVALFELEETQSADAHEVANYTAALNHGLRLIHKGHPLTLKVILELHRILMTNVRGKDKSPGRFRVIQNFIGTSTDIRKARFVPPPVAPINHVEKLMDNFERYINEQTDRHPLIQAALMHYQFEAIHPFLDGNGRLGRLLVVLFLAQKGIMPKPLLYLSAYFEKNRNEYIDCLLAVSQRGAWDEWVNYFLTGVAEQATDAVGRAKKLVRTWNRMRDDVTKAKTSVLALSLIDKLFQWPAITIPKAAELLDVQYASARNNITRLVEAGILIQLDAETQSGTRAYGKVFICPEIISIIEDDTLPESTEVETIDDM